MDGMQMPLYMNSKVLHPERGDQIAFVSLGELLDFFLVL